MHILKYKIIHPHNSINEIKKSNLCFWEGMGIWPKQDGVCNGMCISPDDGLNVETGEIKISRKPFNFSGDT